MLRIQPHSYLVAVIFFLALGACGTPQTIQERMDYAEKDHREAEKLLDQADVEMNQLQVEPAEEMLTHVTEITTHAEFAAYPEHEYIEHRLEESKAKLVETKKEVKRRAFEAALAEQRSKVKTSLEKWKVHFQLLQKPDMQREGLENFIGHSRDLEDQLKDGEELEKGDTTYAKFVENIRNDLRKAAVELKKSEAILAFREGPVRLQNEAIRKKKEASQSKQTEQKDLYEDSLRLFRDCGENARNMLREVPSLQKAKLKVQQQMFKPPDVLAKCLQEGRLVEEKIKKIDEKTKIEMRRASQKKLKRKA